MIPAGIHCIRGEKKIGIINRRENSPYLVEEMMGDGHHTPVKQLPGKKLLNLKLAVKMGGNTPCNTKTC